MLNARSSSNMCCSGAGGNGKGETKTTIGRQQEVPKKERRNVSALPKQEARARVERFHFLLELTSRACNDRLSTYYIKYSHFRLMQEFYIQISFYQNILMLYIPLTANTCTLDLRNKEHLLIITSGGSIW